MLRDAIDSDNAPTLNDLHTDASVQTSGVFEAVESYFDSESFVTELDRAFGYDQPLEYDDEELARMWAEEQEARNAPAAKWEPFDLPAPQTVDTILRMPNPSAWGKAVSL